MCAALLEYDDAQDAISSPNGAHEQVTIIEVKVTPGGTRRPTTRSEVYKRKRAVVDEDKDAKASRVRGGQMARERALLKFDPEKKAAANAERRQKRAAKGAKAPRTLAALPAPAAMPAQPQPAANAGSAGALSSAQERARQRDWALLHKFKEFRNPAMVLESLRLDGLLDNDDILWTATRVQEHAEDLQRCVRVAARLVGTTDPLHDMHALMELCV